MKISSIVYLLLLLSVLSCSETFAQNAVSCPEAAKFYAKDSINIVTFGASTVEGVGGVNFQSFLKDDFTNCYTGKVVDITNHGIGGQTTKQGLLRIDAAIAGRTGFIVINMGINDANALALNRVGSLAETEANMRLLITTSLKQKLIPIICTLQNVDDRTDRRLVAVNSTIRSINAIYRRLATEYKLYLADINSIMRRDFSLYQDSYHPNARGYRLISYIIFDTINKAIFDNFLMFVVSQNYPNPASNVTYLDIVMPAADKINIQIFDMMGRLVKTVVNEYLNTGKHTLEINTEAYAPGVYFFRVSSDSGLYSSAKKFIISR